MDFDFDEWFVRLERGLTNLMTAMAAVPSPAVTADHAISTPAVDSTCGVVGPVQANCDRTELVPVPATHHGSSSPTNISLETLGVDPSACTGFITTAPATCLTACVAQTIPVFTAAAASDGTFDDGAKGWCDSNTPRPMPWPSWLKTASAPATAPTTPTAIVDITKRYVFVSHEANKNGVLSMVTTNCDDKGEDQRPPGPPPPLVLVYVMSELQRDKETSPCIKMQSDEHYDTAMACSPETVLMSMEEHQSLSMFWLNFQVKCITRWARLSSSVSCREFLFLWSVASSAVSSSHWFDPSFGWQNLNEPQVLQYTSMVVYGFSHQVHYCSCFSLDTGACKSAMEFQWKFFIISDKSQVGFSAFSHGPVNPFAQWCSSDHSHAKRCAVIEFQVLDVYGCAGSSLAGYPDFPVQSPIHFFIGS